MPSKDPQPRITTGFTRDAKKYQIILQKKFLYCPNPPINGLSRKANQCTN